MIEEKQAYVSNIQHFCIHDGNGFRTTIFLQGCPLRCRWCQNPELQVSYPIHMWDTAICVGCHVCQEVCNKKNLSIKSQGFRPLDVSKCMDCQQDSQIPCVDSCSYGARSFSSKRMTASAVLVECLKEQNFWGDGGGITLSGGEPLLQVEFCEAIAELCRVKGIDLAVETCGYVPCTNIKAMVGQVNTYLYDLKLISTSLRKKWLGISGRQDLDNLQYLAGTEEHIVLRIPLVPGINDSEQEFGNILDFACSLNTVYDLHILPFHQFGAGKYNMAGMRYELQNLLEDNEANIVRAKHMAESRGFKVDVGGTSFT